MIKAVKKLNKLWSRKKKRKKIHHYQQPYYHFPPPPPPPPPCYLCCSYATTAQPSAPPLPPWLQAEQTREEDPENGLQRNYSLHDHLVYPSEEGCEEIVVETSSSSPTNASAEYSYQQYMEPNPVYGVPVVQVTRRERPAGFFDRLVKFAANLFGCVCPCFRIREANSSLM